VILAWSEEGTTVKMGGERERGRGKAVALCAWGKETSRLGSAPVSPSERRKRQGPVCIGGISEKKGKSLPYPRKKSLFFQWSKSQGAQYGMIKRKGKW